MSMSDHTPLLCVLKPVRKTLYYLDAVINQISWYQHGSSKCLHVSLPEVERSSIVLVSLHGSSAWPRCLVWQNSSTYWEGNAAAESLQRVYGISFPDTKQVTIICLNVISLMHFSLCLFHS